MKEKVDQACEEVGIAMSPVSMEMITKLWRNHSPGLPALYKASDGTRFSICSEGIPLS
jgi:hypothetical protein